MSYFILCIDIIVCIGFFDVFLFFFFNQKTAYDMRISDWSSDVCSSDLSMTGAIVAVAPVIEAKAEDVTSALAFTAGLGILAVFLLPLLYHHSGLSVSQYGVVAGISGYAVPQVLAATAPIGLLSVQIGTTAKPIRVLMLGPAGLLFGLAVGMGHQT